MNSIRQWAELAQEIYEPEDHLAVNALANHILRETDPSPVTMEAMRERGFYCRYMTNEMAHDKIPGDFCCDNGQCQWVINGRVSFITSIGQLDTLLRGLGCTG